MNEKVQKIVGRDDLYIKIHNDLEEILKKNKDYLNRLNQPKNILDFFAPSKDTYTIGIVEHHINFCTYLKKYLPRFKLVNEYKELAEASQLVNHIKSNVGIDLSELIQDWRNQSNDKKLENFTKTFTLFNLINLLEFYCEQSPNASEECSPLTEHFNKL